MKVKRMLFFLAVVVTAFFNTQYVSAGSNDATITYQRIDNAYFYIQNKSTGAVDTNHVTKFFMNGKIAFCIEPMVDITGKVYNSTNGLASSGLSTDVRRKIELYGHYGYEYPGHNTDRYWLATQELIWETAGNVTVKFTTGANGSGSEINLNNEKNEILRLANRNDIKPSFNTDTIEGNIGDTITLTDVNGVLNEYNMTYNGKHKVTKNGNTLTITLNDKVMGLDEIRFFRKNYDNQTTVLYYQGNSQKLATIRLSDPSVGTVKIKSNGATVEVYKKGEDLIFENAGYKYEEISLKNVTYAVYADEDILDLNGNVVYKKYSLVGTITTGEEGMGTLKDLYFGKYFILEGETDPNHVIDNEKYKFEITKDDVIDGKLIKHFDFKNFYKKGTLKFTKTDLATGKPIPNTTIQIFTKEDRLIFTGTTDNKGEIIIDNLPVGIPLYMIEKNPATGYKITDEVIYFEITENGEVVKAEMKNEKIEEQKKEIVKVPDTAMDDYSDVKNIVLIISGFLLLIFTGFALYFYDKRQK